MACARRIPSFGVETRIDFSSSTRTRSSPVSTPRAFRYSEGMTSLPPSPSFVMVRAICHLEGILPLHPTGKLGFPEGQLRIPWGSRCCAEGSPASLRERALLSCTRELPSGEAGYPRALTASPGGQLNCPTGKRDFPGEHEDCAAGLAYFPTGKRGFSRGNASSPEDLAASPWGSRLTPGTAPPTPAPATPSPGPRSPPHGPWRCPGPPRASASPPRGCR